MGFLKTGTWADVQPGDKVLAKGVRYVIEARNGDEITMRPAGSPNAPARTGRPDPAGAIQYSRTIALGGEVSDHVEVTKSPIDLCAGLDVIERAVPFTESIDVGDVPGHDSLCSCHECYCEVTGDMMPEQCCGGWINTTTGASGKCVGCPGEPVAADMAAERRVVGELAHAGLEPVVIERVMSHDDLHSHLFDTHGVAPAGSSGATTITLFERRRLMADQHFALHLDGQAVRAPWQPRGRTPHTHPVMDRPMP